MIRKAKPGDFGALKNLNKELLDETGEYFSDTIFQQEALFNLLINSENQVVIVAEDDGVICGYAITVISHMPDNDSIRLDQIFVKPEYRLKGIAQRIIIFITELAKKEYIDVISLRVNSKNESAISFYKKKGFVVEELIMNKRF